MQKAAFPLTFRREFQNFMALKARNGKFFQELRTFFQKIPFKRKVKGIIQYKIRKQEYFFAIAFLHINK